MTDDRSPELPANIVIASELEGHERGVRQLHDAVFGPTMFTRAAYAIREQGQMIDEFALVAIDTTGADQTIVGSIRYCSAAVGSESIAFLGPFAVAHEHAGRGIGGMLIFRSLRLLEAASVKRVMLVGDFDYYRRFGFRRAPSDLFHFDRPVDPSRILIRELEDGAFDDLAGLVRGAP